LKYFPILCAWGNWIPNLYRLEPAWIISDDDGGDDNKSDHDNAT